MTDKKYTDRPMRSQFRKRAEYDKAVEEWKKLTGNEDETQADGIQAERLHHLRVRLLMKGRQGQTLH